jgi:hypothetical protein
VALVVFGLSLTTSASSQRGPVVRPGTVDPCLGFTDAYWIDSLHDALVDRAPFICGCRNVPGAGRITMSLEVRPPGVLASCEPSDFDLAQDAASCVSHRVHTVAHAWLASTVSHLRPPSGAVAGTISTYDFLAIACPAGGGTDVQSAFSRAFIDHHPNGLRTGVAIPPTACRHPLAASLRVPFAW